MLIKDRLKKQRLLFDGAFGTYYAKLYDTEELPELANTLYPERVKKIHEEYILSGADIIRTNTFASNTISLNTSLQTVKENIRAAYRIARVAAAKQLEKYVAADIGEIPYENQEEKEAVRKEYVEIAETFLKEGADIFVFETFSDIEDILDAIEYINDRAFVIVQFAVNQFGYSNAGLSARKLLERAGSMEWIDAIGFNCGIGPGHMYGIIKNMDITGDKFITALPNAGYPQNAGNRINFSNPNIDYFTDKICDIALLGVDIVGGCCGTTPEYIRKLSEKLSSVEEKKHDTFIKSQETVSVAEDNAFYAGKGNKKLIAVELAPPLGSDAEKLMDAAHMLIKGGVDVLTFPDSPSGRTRADSILMADKVAGETGICVMPHICCRDRNAIAIRSQLLGAHINNIKNFLVITGDPIPQMMRGNVKSVFNFDSVGLMNIINDMNEEQFKESPVCFGGAINQGRKNIEFEVSRVRKKMQSGATFFLTQPVSTKEGAERVRYIKEQTNARILCGIMPFVSLKNATFMKNEMTGIDVTDEVLARYRENMTKEEGEEAGIRLAKEMMELTKDFVDGYYFSFPFNRVWMLEKILS